VDLSLQAGFVHAAVYLLLTLCYVLAIRLALPKIENRVPSGRLKIEKPI